MVTVEGERQPLSAQTDHSAYRILQESLTNVLRHAGPGAVATVCLHYQPDVLTMTVTDSGGHGGPRGSGGHGGAPGGLGSQGGTEGRRGGLGGTVLPQDRGDPGGSPPRDNTATASEACASEPPRSAAS